MDGAGAAAAPHRGTLRRDTLIAGRYQSIRVLQKAHYDGRVILALQIDTQLLVAIKMLEIAKIHAVRSLDGHPVSEDPYNELEVLRLLSSVPHRNVMRLIEDFEDGGYLCMVLELVEQGELFDIVASSERLAEDVARNLFFNIMLGLEHVHRHSAHRDMSLENVLLSRTGVPKICDFGLASICPPGALVEGSVGKPCYMPPEMYTQRMYDPRQGDLWSCGIMLFIMLTGLPPMASAELTDVRLAMVTGGEVSLQGLLATWGLAHLFGPGAVNLMARLLVIEPAQRLTVEQVLLHPWLRPELDAERARAAAALAQAAAQEPPPVGGAAQ